VHAVVRLRRRLREVFVDIFAVEEANKDDGIVLKCDAYAVITNPDAKIIPAAFELLQVRQIRK
jgi:hypothetical protein